MATKDDLREGRNYGYSEQIDVCLIGPTGVGKTSLLATMHQQLQNYLPHNVQFKPLNNELFQKLTGKYRELEKVADIPPHSLAVSDGEGTQGIQTYSFGFNFVPPKGEPDKFLQVNFHDTPGRYTSDLHAELLAKVNCSQVIINAVDAGVMMEASRENALAYNGYDQVARILDESFADARNRLVLMVPIKAETWIGNCRSWEKEENALIRRAGEHLAPITKLFNFENRLGIVVPVETMGCVRFLTAIPDGKGGEIIHYARTEGKFQPRYIHFPLLYTLYFLAAEYYRSRGFLARWWHRYISSYTDLLKALEAAEGSIGGTPPPMSVYGNSGLLDFELGAKKDRLGQAKPRFFFVDDQGGK